MENDIKESKYGFSMDKISTHSFDANQMDMLIKLLAYNLFEIFKKRTLSASVSFLYDQEVPERIHLRGWCAGLPQPNHYPQHFRNIRPQKGVPVNDSRCPAD